MLKAHCLSSILIVLWFAFYFSVSSSQTPPTDKYNCPLNNSNPFSYLVQVWDSMKSYYADRAVKPGTASWGALITYKAVVSSAWYFHRASEEAEFSKEGYKRFRLIAQNIWEWTPAGRKDPCYQEGRISQINYHPGSDKRGIRLFFDYSVLVLEKPFVIAVNTSYPTIPVHIDPFVLLLAIRYVNTHEEAYCEMPVPISSEPGNRSIINDRIEVSSIKFHDKCIRIICEQNPSDPSSPNCMRAFHERLNGTMLCMKPGWTSNFSIEEVPNFPNNYAGMPLVCNSYVLGLSPHIKRRGSLQYKDYPQDFFYVITLLRVWPWLSKLTVAYRHAPQPFYVYNLTKKDYTDPPRASTPDYGKSSFFGFYDDGATAAPAFRSGTPSVLESLASPFCLVLSNIFVTLC